MMDSAAEEALRLSEQRYRTLLYAIAETVWTTDAVLPLLSVTRSRTSTLVGLA